MKIYRKRAIKIYSKDTDFDFGKHENFPLEVVAQADFSYVDWCLRIVDYFCLENDYFEEIKHLLSQDAQIRQTEKIAEYENEQDDDDDYDDHDYDRDTFNALTDGQYGDYEDFGGNFWD